jgi:hypothetical protein
MKYLLFIFIVTYNGEPSTKVVGFNTKDACVYAAGSIEKLLPTWDGFTTNATYRYVRAVCTKKGLR